MEQATESGDISIRQLGGLNQRVSPLDLPPNEFPVLEGYYPSQQGLLSRLPGKQKIFQLEGRVMSIHPTYNSAGHVLIQTDQHLYLSNVDEILGRTVSNSLSTNPNPNPGSGGGGGADTTPPTQPANLTALNVAPTGMNLVWDASTDNVGVTNYTVYMQTGGSGAYVLIGITVVNALIVAGLVASTSYKFYVQANDAAGNVSTASSIITQSTAAGGGGDVTPPTQPTNLVASVITSSTLTLNWTASTDAVGVVNYSVLYQVNGSGPFNLLGIAVSNSFNATGLVSATLYNFYVQANDAAGNISVPSNTVTATTLSGGGGGDTIPPTQPSNVVISNVTSGSLNLTWTASTDNVGVVNYTVYKQTAGTGSFALQGITNVPSLAISGLTASTLYGFYVQANDAAGNVSVASVTVTTTTSGSSGDVTAPTAPSNLSLVSVAATTAGLTWTISTDAVGVTGYIIYQRLGNSGAFTQSGTSTGNTFTVTGLTQNSSYDFQIKAFDAAGNLSAASNTLSVITTDSGGGGGTTTVADEIILYSNKLTGVAGDPFNLDNTSSIIWTDIKIPTGKTSFLLNFTVGTRVLRLPEGEYLFDLILNCFNPTDLIRFYCFVPRQTNSDSTFTSPLPTNSPTVVDNGICNMLLNTIQYYRPKSPTSFSITAASSLSTNNTLGKAGSFGEIESYATLRILKI